MPNRFARPLRAFASTWLQAWVPPLCRHCGDRRWADCPLCLPCLRALRAARLPAEVPAVAPAEANFAGPICLYRLEPQVQTLIHGFKYRGFRWELDFLARGLDHWPGGAREGLAAACDWVVPVPLHPARRRERGYNQAARLATALAARLGRPMREDLLLRRRDTPSQTRLGPEARRRNVGGAFRGRPGAEGARVALVDDVFTTGATASACADALNAVGITEITIFALARAEPERLGSDFRRELELVAAFGVA